MRGPIANNEVDRLGREVSGAELKAMFWREYIERAAPWQLKRFEAENRNGTVRCRARLLREGKPVERRDVRVIRSLSDLTEEELIAIAAESGVADDRE